MGMAKQRWMERQEDEHFEERMEWIREQLEDPEADEDHPKWDELSEEFDTFYSHSNDYDDDWEIRKRSMNPVLADGR